MEFKHLKIELIKRNKTFIELARKDGRSRQYLHRECSKKNEKVIKELFEILKKL
ncbi:MAG: hypothetical protein ACRC18_09125 [Cetobacterium sp.]